MAEVRALAEGIGPRLAGSEGEARAAEWLAEEFRRAGYEAEVDTFPAAASFVPAYALLTSLGAGSLLLAWWQPWLGLVGGLLAGGLLVAENLTCETVSRLLKRVRSRNVEACRNPGGKPEHEIVVLAHLDSALVSAVPRIEVVYRLFLGMIASCLAVAAVAGAVLLGVGRATLLLGLPPAALLATCTAIMLYQYRRADVVAGAHDNASGVAAMLAAARGLPPLRRSTVRFVGTGAEESGLSGALRLLSRRRFDRTRTWFINVDMVGGEGLSAGSAEGMLLRLRPDPHLCQVAEEEATALGFALGPGCLRHMSTDACVPLLRGYRAVTLHSTLSDWHRPTDTTGNVRPETVAQASALLRRMIVRLDAESGQDQD